MRNENLLWQETRRDWGWADVMGTGLWECYRYNEWKKDEKM